MQLAPPSPPFSPHRKKKSQKTQERHNDVAGIHATLHACLPTHNMDLPRRPSRGVWSIFEPDQIGVARGRPTGEQHRLDFLFRSLLLREHIIVILMHAHCVITRPRIRTGAIRGSEQGREANIRRPGFGGHAHGTGGEGGR